jgi:hypothetical protein
MKKTALEWYAEQAMRLEIEKAKGNISMNEMLNQLSNVLDQSKEMEKDQICNAYVYGSAYGINMQDGLHPINYYNETYKK